MVSYNEDAAVLDLRQEQMLKLVTKGFYKELVNYGIGKEKAITVASNLLDCLLKDMAGPTINVEDEYYNRLFTVKDIQDGWEKDKRLAIRDVSVFPLKPEHCAQAAVWLGNPAIKYNFIPPFPESEQGLREYFASPGRAYFTICYKNEPVGLIGADNMDHESRKLEMKKCVGNTGMQGKGIGKLATFLFLYYSFNIIGFEKVYIHSSDANIRNIALNSKFGFEFEGVFFDDILVQSKKKDVVRMGLLKSRWADIFSQ